MDSLKDVLIKQVAVQMELSESLVRNVISFQGEDAAKAAHVHNEIEFSGFGKFLFSKTKTKRKIMNMEKKLEEGRVREEDMERYLLHMENLKQRIDEQAG